jgi:hypothetical protein
VRQQQRDGSGSGGLVLDFRENERETKEIKRENRERRSVVLHLGASYYPRIWGFILFFFFFFFVI